RRGKTRAWRGRSVSEGWPRSPPLRGRCRRSRQRGVFMPRVASGWITPLCPAGHLLLKGGDWLHRRPTLVAVPPAVVIGCAGWRDATRPAAGQAWMATTLNPDICVIGGTAGGVAVAAGAAAFGVPVVLVEKGRI